jgi:hypothetical protein
MKDTAWLQLDFLTVLQRATSVLSLLGSPQPAPSQDEV